MSSRFRSTVLLPAMFALAASGCSGGGGGPIPAAGTAPASGTPAAHAMPDARTLKDEFRDHDRDHGHFQCQSVSNAFGFNSTQVPSGDSLWLSSVMQVNGASNGAIIYMANSQVTFNLNGKSQTISTPDAAIVIDPHAKSPQLVYSQFFNLWVADVPVNTAGNVFLDGAALGLRQSLPGGITPVTWTATFLTDTSTVSFNWQWGAAAYTRFNSDPNRLGVKPLDDPHYAPYNSDPAGTPENYKSYVTGGGTGNGGTQYIGALSPALGVVPCGANPSPTPSPTPTPPANTAIVGDAGYNNGQLSVAYLPSKSVTVTGQPAFEDLDSVAYVSGANAGVLGNGATQNIVPFSLSGTNAILGNPISFANPDQCVPSSTCYATAVVMPDVNTAISALNATGSNYLLEVSNPASATPAFTQIPVTIGSPEDTSGLAMSPDGKVLVARGAHLDVFGATAPDAYSQVSQITQADSPDHTALRGREGMSVFQTTSDYELLATGTSSGPQNGTLSLWTGLLGGNTNRTTSTRIDPSLHAYAVTTDGKTAFVGTDVGVALVTGVDSKSFASDTTNVVSPLSCVPGSTGLVQISTLALTPDGKSLVVMGLPAPATAPGGVNGCLDVLPVTYGPSGVSLGAAVESLPIVVPYDDQLQVF